VQKLRQQLGSAQAEADKSRRALSARVDELSRQNKELSSKIVTAEKTAPQESTELQKLRKELGASQAEADKARKAMTAREEELSQQNKALAAKLAAAEKLAGKESPELQKLRSELSAAKLAADKDGKVTSTREADLARENKELIAKLAAAQKTTTPATESAEIKKLKAELATAKTDAENAKRETAKLASAPPKTVTVAATDTEELKKLRQELAAAKSDLDKAKRETVKFTDLQQQNTKLKAELASAKQPVVTREPADARRLRVELEKVQETTKKNAEVMERLREENAFLRNLLDTYAQRNPELKGQLRRYTPTTETAQ